MAALDEKQRFAWKGVFAGTGFDGTG